VNTPKPKDRRKPVAKTEDKKTPFVHKPHLTDRPMKNHTGLQDLLRDMGGAPRRRTIPNPKKK
jgi:hypothetical protein